MPRQSLKSMSGDAIDATSFHFDYSEGYGERWEYHEGAECQECGAFVPNVRGQDQHSDVDQDSECKGYLSAEGPMMSYFYALPSAPSDVEGAQRALASLPLCLVEITEGEQAGRWGLALTGGGMDLSWEIAQAYMALGYLPPAWVRLPAMSGRGYSAKDRWIASGCIASARVTIKRAQFAIRDVKRTLEAGRERDPSRKGEQSRQA